MRVHAGELGDGHLHAALGGGKVLGAHALEQHGDAHALRAVHRERRRARALGNHALHRPRGARVALLRREAWRRLLLGAGAELARGGGVEARRHHLGEAAHDGDG